MLTRLNALFKIFFIFFISTLSYAETMKTTLDNGLNIQVPPFIEAGDEVVVDTRSLEYIKKI